MAFRSTAADDARLAAEALRDRPHVVVGTPGRVDALLSRSRLRTGEGGTGPVLSNDGPLAVEFHSRFKVLVR